MRQARAATETVLDPIRRPIALTRGGMIAERVTRAFWPLWSVLFAALGLLMLGVQDMVPVEVVWTVAGLAGLGAPWALWRGLRRFRMPSREDAVARLDATLADYIAEAVEADAA